MANKMDGVKISVKSESEEEAPEQKVKKQVKKKPAPKKKVAVKKPANVAEKKVEKREEPKGKAEVPKSKKTLNRPSTSKKGILSLLVPVVITALVVGGGVYAWQRKATDADIKDARNDARESRMSFEKRLSDLKNKLTGVETENVELKTVQDDLAEKTSLLNEAKLEFSDEDLGVRFLYPAVFGKVAIKFNEGTTGRTFVGTFSKNDKLVFGGVSKEFLPDSTTVSFALTDTMGFKDTRNKYYFLPLGNEDSTDYEIKPAKVIGFSGGEALLVDNKSFTEQESMPNIDIGQNVGLIANLPGDEFAGIAFINSDFGVLPVDGFEEMAKSIETDK